VEIFAQSSADFALTFNFQGTHILSASRGYLSDSVIFLLYVVLAQMTTRQCQVQHRGPVSAVQLTGSYIATREQMALIRSRQRQQNSDVLTRVLLVPTVLLLSGVPGDVTYMIVIVVVSMLTKMV